MHSLPSLLCTLSLLFFVMGCAAEVAPSGHPVVCEDAGSCQPAPGISGDGDSDVVGNGEPEVCNGVDDDLDGRVDNLDAAGDGICDCLSIGLVGRPGKWGGGSAFAEWLLDRGSYVEELHDAPLTAETLSTFDILIVNDVTDDDNATHGIGRPYSAAEIAALEGWVQAGGGLMTMIGYWSARSVTNVNGLLAPFGMSYGERSILQRSGTYPVEDWHATHPLARNINAIGAQNGNQPLGDGTVFAWDEASGVDAGLAQSETLAVGDGRVVVWGDEWITYDALWNDRPDYDVEQLWVNLANWLTPRDSCEIDYVIIIG